MVEKPNSIEELLDSCPKNQIIGDNLIRAWTKSTIRSIEK